jgi:GH25 family lysozyme M1 (1,4-beta-N-acetylmuramidase)
MYPLYILALSILSAAAIASPLAKRADPQGIDVSNHQGTINWNSLKSKVAFAYIKATEGTSKTHSKSYCARSPRSTYNPSTTDFIDPDFSANYKGATKIGIIRGAYHFARPDKSSGAAQATYFLAHGGPHISSWDCGLSLTSGCRRMDRGRNHAAWSPRSRRYFSAAHPQRIF